LKVIAKPIEMVAWFDTNGTPEPIKFRAITKDNSMMTIKIDKVIRRDLEKLAGNHMFVFQCQSNIQGKDKVYELKYELGTCKWLLWKM
jgi:hypothetical protein